MLEQVDLSAKMTKEEYKPLHDELIAKLVVLQQEARKKGVGVVALLFVDTAVSFFGVL